MLPVKEMVLYKHGIGFFVRAGEVSGTQIVLNFRVDEINDVLKSLAVFDRSGGQVLGVDYQTPMDRDDRLKNSSINLAANHSLTDLIEGVRGRQVHVEVRPDEGQLFSISGRVVGYETSLVQEGRDSLTRSVMVMILDETGSMRFVNSREIRALRVADELSERDLNYFLNTVMSEDNRRSVTLRLSDGDHDLVLYYVAPSPTWRVSYRLVAESDAEESGKGAALLQGWGLFDNRLDEDLEDVRLTLVAGQPISFIYELYASRIPERPHVGDIVRAAPRPQNYKSEMSRSAPARLLRRLEPGMQADEFAQAEPMAMAAGMSMDDAASSVMTTAETKDSGETFQYVVSTPVSVQRGQSAMVPIISSRISYERELLYNRAKLPDHPVAALRFKNDSGLTLERGPVTVVEDGEYRGEAVLPFTKNETEVYVPFAVELGIEVTEFQNQQTITAGLNIEGGIIIYEDYLTERTTYKIQNNTPRDQVVTIEQNVHEDESELYDTRSPDASGADYWRWRVEVKAQSLTEFSVRTRRRISRRQAVLQLKYEELARFLKKQWIGESVFEALHDILRTVERIEEFKRGMEERDEKRQRIYDEQEQLRSNLGALTGAGRESELRDRLLTQLTSSQDRLDALGREDEQARRDLQAAEKKLAEMLRALG